MKTLSLFLCFTALLLCGNNAAALTTTIDFENVPGGAIFDPSYSYTELRFSADGTYTPLSTEWDLRITARYGDGSAVPFAVLDTTGYYTPGPQIPFSQNVLYTYNPTSHPQTPSNPIYLWVDFNISRITVTSPLLSPFRVAAGDNGNDNDHTHLNVYAADGSLLGSDDVYLNNIDWGGAYLNVNSSGAEILTPIASASFWEDGAGTDLFGNPANGNLAWDNLIFEYEPVGSPPQNPVPEPATLLLLGSGLAGLAGFGKKMRKR